MDHAARLRGTGLTRKRNSDVGDRLGYRWIFRGISGNQVTKVLSFPSEESAEVFAIASRRHRSLVKRSEPLDVETQLWLKTLPSAVKMKLIEGGLLSEFDRVAAPEITCEQVADWYIKFVETRRTIAATTVASKKRSAEYFATVMNSRKIADLHEGHGNQLATALYAGKGFIRERFAGAKLRKMRVLHDLEYDLGESDVRLNLRAQSSVGKHLERIAECFKIAHRNRIIDTNPWSNLERHEQEQRETWHIEPWMMEELFKLTADKPEQTVVLALARYAGIRMQSELSNLRWGHVSFDDEIPSILIHSSKNRHKYPTRTVPMHFGLQSILLRCRPSGFGSDDFVVARESYRQKGGTACASWLKKLVRRAGIQQWPGIWQSFRVSCEHDMRDIEGVNQRQVDHWIGHSEKTYTKHYFKFSRRAAAASQCAEAAARAVRLRAELAEVEAELARAESSVAMVAQAGQMRPDDSGRGREGQDRGRVCLPHE